MSRLILLFHKMRGMLRTTTTTNVSFLRELSQEGATRSGPLLCLRQLAWNALGLSASILLPSRDRLFLDAQWPPPFQDEDIIGGCRAIAYSPSASRSLPH